MSSGQDARVATASRRPTVLLVDDQARNLDVLEAMLEPLDCTFVRALSADEALLALLRHDFAAIVLDIRMPGMSGLELAAVIKQRKRSQHVPILFLTAHLVEEQDVLRGYGVGAVDYLSKPINPDILRSKVGVFIELYQTSRALGELNETLRREVVDREQAQEALRVANHALEERVQERTAELIRVHRGVSENELRLRLAIEVAHMAAWEWHLTSGRMTWSTDPEALFGFPAGSFGEELRTSSLVHPEDKVALEMALAAALGSGIYQVEYRAVRPDGSVIWLTDRGRIASDAEGRPDRMVGITRDITLEREAIQEREQLLRASRQARDEAQAADRAKDEFLAMLSHELRNPLHVIAVGLSVLDGAGKPPELLARTRQLIVRQVRHLTRLLDDLLDVARVAKGRIALNLRAVDLGAAVDRCLTALMQTTELPARAVRKRLEPVWINADETRIEQVITNLIANAIKFTPAGGQIEVTVAGSGDQVLFCVSDNGMGVDPSMVSRIFDVFVQGDQSLDRTQGGLGLGLALVRRLTEMHNGSVSVQSEGRGRGATFTVRLPRTEPPADDPPSPPASAGPRRRRILIVEDNEDGRELVRAMLQAEGHEVFEAADGETAIRRARELRPDVVIVDIGLPGIDGYEVAARLRAPDSGLRNLRLLAVTGYGTEGDRRRASEAGFDAQLTKPVEPESLIRLLG